MGPNNTNTPTSTPAAGNAPGVTPTPPPAPAPVFSGPAPTTNPFSGQNSIPSSATGDIVVSSDNSKSKKGLIIAIVIIAIIAIGATIAAIIFTQPYGSTNSTTATLSDVKSSFASLANVLISGDQSSTTPNFNLDPANWQLTEIANSSNPETQFAYADTLNSIRSTYYSNVDYYISQHPQKDLSKLVNQSSALNDKLIASIIFLRGDKFATDLTAVYLEDPTTINNAIEKEVELGYEVFDGSSAELVGDVTAYYDAVINRIRIFSDYNCLSSTKINDSCVANLRADYDTYPDLQLVDSLTYVYVRDANDKFKELTLELPALLNSINTIMEGLNE